MQEEKEAEEKLELCGVDDFHHHFRDGDKLTTTTRLASRQFSRCIAMPNLTPPVVTAQDAVAYRERLLAHGATFQPLMTIYLTDETTPDDIIAAQATGVVHAVKLYPAGATTNSQNGVTDLARVLPALKQMQASGLVLCVHGEVTDPEVDMFDREAAFLQSTLLEIENHFSQGLKIVLEHCTTRAAVEHVLNASENVAGTITPQHLLHSRTRLFHGGRLRPHSYCLPVLKTEDDRQALLEAATGGSGRFFLGTDSAPHPRNRKEASACSAGCFTSPVALEMYAQAFDSVGKIDELEAFGSVYGASFYGLPPPRSEKPHILIRQEQRIPESFPFGNNDEVIPHMAGEILQWSLVSQE